MGGCSADDRRGEGSRVGRSVPTLDGLPLALPLALTPWPGRRVGPSATSAIGLPCRGIPQNVRDVRTFSMAVSQNRVRPPPSPIQMNFAENIFSPTKAKRPNRLQKALAGYMRRSDSKTKATAGKGIRQRSGADEAWNRPPRPL